MECRVARWLSGDNSTVYLPNGLAFSLRNEIVEALFEPPEPEPKLVPFAEALAHMENGGMAKQAGFSTVYVIRGGDVTIYGTSGSPSSMGLSTAMCVPWILLPPEGSGQ
jgi:hypothetical protein